LIATTACFLGVAVVGGHQQRGYGYRWYSECCFHPGISSMYLPKFDLAAMTGAFFDELDE
jgi:hypothetical protein